MGSNNNKKQTQVQQSNDPNARYGSGNDPRGRLQNQSAHQQERFEQQQGPMANQFAYMTGKANEANYGDYTDIMNQYRNIASGGGAYGGEGGGGGDGGGGGYSAFKVSPGAASYRDPFESYAGFKEFGATGGYSPQDIANMRERGISPIRAAYGNAERNLGQQRSLQGGYSPNAVAAQVKMAREQGQSMADATTNVDAGIAQARNAGRLAGYGGMSNIEGQRLGADVDISKFNTGLDFEGQQYNANAEAQAQAANIGAAQSAAANRAASAAASRDDQLRALSGMTNLYGTTPGMSNMFGNQLLQGVGQGASFGLGLYGNDIAAQARPGQYDQTMGRINSGLDMVSRAGNMISPYLRDERNKKQQPTVWSQGDQPVYKDYSNPYVANPGLGAVTSGIGW